MAMSRRAGFLRGRRLRATRLDLTGRPVYGDESTVVTKGFISVGMEPQIEEGEGVNVPNAGGEACLFENAEPQFNGFTVTAEFCEVDFALFELLTGQPVVIDPVSGKIVGITENMKINLADVNFALELWMGAKSADTPSASGDGFYGYLLLPRLRGGTIGAVTIENGGITFTVENIVTKDGALWGAGPYKVELGAGGTPVALTTPMTASDARRIQVVEVAPPAETNGAVPLLDPADADVTSLTATPTGLSVAIAPTPAGTDPMWYDFGDGTWDYAETGSYTHVYDAAGTYTIIGYRGDSSASTQVTVTA